MPRPAQTVVHCHPDPSCIGQHFVADFALSCDPVAMIEAVGPPPAQPPPAAREEWAARLRGLHQEIARWPAPSFSAETVDFTSVVHALARLAPADTVVTLDAGTFGAPFYRHFPFRWPQRLLAPISGAMGYGLPAAIAAQMRLPATRVVCALGDGGSLMTGNEIIAAVQRRLPILILLSNNDSYGSIRIHQDREYPGRHLGTSLFNPDFLQIARGFGVQAERVSAAQEIEPALRRGLACVDGPYLIEFRTKVPTPAARAAAGASLSD